MTEVPPQDTNSQDTSSRDTNFQEAEHSFNLLSADHSQALAASAISLEVMRARGYRTVTSRAELDRLGFGTAQRLVPTLLMPVYDIHGDPSLYVHRPDTPRMRDGKVVKYEIPRGAKVAVDVNPLLRDQVRDPAIPLFITEGTKKADAAISAGLCCISLIGVWNWRGTNEWGGKTTLPDWEGIALKDARNRPRQVYLVFDSDVMLKKSVHQALSRLGEFLKQRGAKVAFIYFPTGEQGAKTGLDDYLARGRTVDELLRLASSELRDLPPGEGETTEEDYARTADGLPTIETARRHLRHVTQDALNALVKANHPPRLFVRSGTLTRIREDENGRAGISDLSTATLRVMVSRSANFVFTSRQNGTSAITPPPAVIEDTLGLGLWPQLPPLVSIVTAPVVSETGKLMTTPGYHPDARLYYHAPAGFKVPSIAPTPKTVEAARDRVNDLFADFPFADAASRAHAWALLLLPFVRPLIEGPTPLHLIDAPKAGTGKGLLAQVCTALFVPEGAMIQMPPSTEEEWSKMLTTVFLDGASHLLLDNARNLNSPKLFGALTARTWTDRKLGGNEKVTLQNRLIWAATCNNIAGGDELTRRSVWIRLDAGVEQPDERKGFRHADLASHVAQNRASLIGAVMTLIRHWLEQGRPPYAGSCPPVGSFEGWTRVMGGLLETIGISGFLENRAALRSRADNDTTAWHGFVNDWWEAHGTASVGASDLFGLATEWLADRLGDGQERSQKTKFGRVLRSHLDRVYDGKKVTSGGTVSSGNSKGTAAYCLVDTNPPAEQSIQQQSSTEPLAAQKVVTEMDAAESPAQTESADKSTSAFLPMVNEEDTFADMNDEDDEDGWESL